MALNCRQTLLPSLPRGSSVPKRLSAPSMSMEKQSYYQRNQAKLQAYQREYARRKRAPGHRKVSKAERQLLEDQYVKKQSLMETEGPSPTPSTAISQAYTCSLIVRSRAVDPRRTAGVAEQEEMAQEYFETLKDTLREESPRWWKKDFKHAITEFIAERLEQREIRLMIPCEDEEEEEEQRIYLHALRRFVAGAVQELELAQQPKYASMCAKLEGALVWQGRGVNLRKFRKLYGW